MKKLVNLFFISLLILGVGCSDDEYDKMNVNVPTKDYMLGENCKWTFLQENAVLTETKLYRIDAMNELLPLITCPIKTVVKEIDFEKNTLLVFQDVMHSRGFETKNKLTYKPKLDSYFLKVNVHMGNFLMPATEKYVVSLLVPKLAKDSTIDFEIEVHPYSK